MNSKYESPLKAFVTRDKKRIARQVLHIQEPALSNQKIPRSAAFDYIRNMADDFKISESHLQNMQKPLAYNTPIEQDMELRIVDEKRYFDSNTIRMAQTINNIPIWRKGLTVTVKQNPNRIVYAANNTVASFRIKLTSEKAISRYQSMFASIAHKPIVPLLSEEGQKDDPQTGDFVRGFAMNIKANAKTDRQAGKRNPARLIRGRMYYYAYDENKRQAVHSHNITKDKVRVGEEHEHPSFPLPPIDKSIKNGQYYLVAEITFAWKIANEMQTWLALVEMETGSILYIEPLFAGVSGKVFVQDPITSSGDTTQTANLNNATLNPYRTSVTLNNLDAPVGGVQSLTGSNVQLVDVDGRTEPPPTKAVGDDFDYNVRTNDFAAVSAYYHTDNFFETIESLGFDLSTYFTNTSFPVDIDHADQIDVNAHCMGNGVDGIDHSGYGYGDETNMVDPTIGRAPDNWVHWHELGGHGILYDHVGTWYFNFAHSAGDGLAAIQNDPTSQLRELGNIERFRYAPFRYPALDRWFNRDVAAGWGWDGSNDIGGYESEQILATSNFRWYRSIGGDSSSLSRRQFASRMATYLILRAVSTLTPETNPTHAQGFCDALMAVDLLDWTSEGISGGAYNKVIRWAFEKQGLFQPAGAPMPVTIAGAPPEIDVYINDGRNGEYEYQAVHWHNISMWNRQHDDGGLTHEDAIPDATNYMYVKVKNRGTSNSGNVNVRGYHCLPGAGLTWPTDFTEMGPGGGLNVASIAANNAEEVIVGPFEWVPNENIYGHDCTLMIVSTDGDPSNVDNFTLGDTVAEWRLVPNDNNIGQRNVTILPGGGGENALIASLHDHFFWAGNPFRVQTKMQLKVELPKFLAEAGWKVQFKDSKDQFTLKPGEKRKMVIDVIKGRDFSTEQVHAAYQRDIVIGLYAEDMLIGGMTYRIDPDKKEPGYIPGKKDRCTDKAQDLLDCLHLNSGKVKKVCIKKVSLDIELNSDNCQCD
ncbi:MAG TPA: hypothetical protein PLL28_03105 [Chitinophagales bacterium]|nr:hypothetical protein [Chitinophagales bacterium]